MEKLHVIIKNPSEDAYATEIPNTLKEQQKIVGGYIEIVPFGMEHLLILNEEGKFIGLKPNIKWNNDIIMGTIILARDSAPEIVSITKEEANWLIQVLNKASVAEHVEGV